MYQVLEKDKADTPEGKKLVAARLVSLQTSGWEVFAITPAVSNLSSVLHSTERILGFTCRSFFNSFHPQQPFRLQCSFLSAVSAMTLGGYILWEEEEEKVLPRASGASSSFPELVSLLCRECLC